MDSTIMAQAIDQCQGGSRPSHLVSATLNISYIFHVQQYLQHMIDLEDGKGRYLGSRLQAFARLHTVYAAKHRMQILKTGNCFKTSVQNLRWSGPDRCKKMPEPAAKRLS
jgi:hypothetical protein